MNQEDFSHIIKEIEGENPEVSRIRVSLRNREVYAGIWSYLDNNMSVIQVVHEEAGKKNRVFIALGAIATVQEAPR